MGVERVGRVGGEDDALGGGDADGAGRGGLFAAAGRVGRVGRALVLGAPAFLWQMFSAYADLATALYASLGVFALAYAMQEGSRRWLWASGVLMGFALATKYTALLTAGLWGVVGLVWLLRAGQSELTPTLVGAGLLAGVIGAPWYLRNYLWTGNPVYPFAYEIFGGKNWSQAQADAYRNDQLKFGLGREPAQLLLAPWNLSASPAPFADPIGAGGRAGVPVAVVGRGRWDCRACGSQAGYLRARATCSRSWGCTRSAGST